MQGKQAVVVVAQLSAAKNLPVLMAARFVCVHIYLQHGAGCQSLALFRFDDEVKMPGPMAKDPFRFLRPTGGKDALWLVAETQREGDVPIDHG